MKRHSLFFFLPSLFCLTSLTQMQAAPTSSTTHRPALVAAPSDSIKLAGHVYDAELNDVLPGVNIAAWKGGKIIAATTSDMDGHWPTPTAR